MHIDLDTNIDELQAIERDANAYLNGKVTLKFLLQSTENHLGRITNGKIRFRVYEVKSTSQYPFIMSVFPDVDELEEKAEKLVRVLNEGNASKFKEEWNSLEKWTIEVDSRFTSPLSEIRFKTGAEYVGILCHELGHIMHTHPMFLCATYNTNKAQYKVFEKVIMNKPIISLLFLPMFVCASGFKMVICKPSHDIDEIAADMLVPDAYKPALMDYMQYNVLNKPYNGLIMTKEEFKNEQEIGVRFSRNAVSLMKKRRNVLKLHLSTQYKMSESPYFKSICKVTSKIVTGENFETNKLDLTKDRYLTESFERNWEIAEKEATTILEAINVSERNIVLLSVDIDNMKTPEDKAFIINTIYDYLDALQYQKEKKAKRFKDVDKIPADSTVDMKIKQLRELEKKVMNTPVSRNGDSYGVFVKYPEGYEG